MERGVDTSGIETDDASDLDIIFVVDRLSRRTAGTEGQLYQLVSGLSRRGARCRLLALQPTEYLSREGFPCPWETVGRDKLSDPRTWHALWRRARRLRRDGARLAHAFFNDASVLAPPAFSLTGLPTLISRRDMGFWYTSSYVRVLRLTRRWVTACIANSQAVRQVTGEVEGIPLDRIKVIYNGVTFESPVEEPIPELEALQQQGFLVAILVANLRPIKRIQDFVEALGQLRDSHPRLAIAIVGAGDPADLQRRAADLGLAERVVFLGSRDDVGNCLRYAEIGVLCSESEGFSNAIVDYMLAGIPAVCTDTGGNPEAVRDGVTGLLYPVGEISALAGHLARLADDRQLRQQMGSAALQAARQRFSVDRMVAEHIAFYRTILRG